jgi:hypothetical protein
VLSVQKCRSVNRPTITIGSAFNNQHYFVVLITPVLNKLNALWFAPFVKLFLLAVSTKLRLSLFAILKWRKLTVYLLRITKSFTYDSVPFLGLFTNFFDVDSRCGCAHMRTDEQNISG